MAVDQLVVVGAGIPVAGAGAGVTPGVTALDVVRLETPFGKMAETE